VVIFDAADQRVASGAAYVLRLGEGCELRYLARLPSGDLLASAAHPGIETWRFTPGDSAVEVMGRVVAVFRRGF
jgi:hypothetical protein